jgi:methionyl aminopeptidase
MKKGIAFPTCVSVNRNICHFSPLSSDTSTLEDKDIVKMYYVYATQPTIPPPSLPPLVTTMKLNVNFLCDSEMAAHVNGYVAIVAHTIEIRKDDDAVRGRAADVIAAANAVAELLTQQIRPRILVPIFFIQFLFPVYIIFSALFSFCCLGI